MLVRQLLERGEVPVVVGVGGIMEGADHLKSVDDDQHRVQVFRQKSLHLLLEPPAQNGALRAEVDVGRGVLRDLKQAVLDAEHGVLQAEVEGGALPGGQPLDPLPLGHGHCQPQGQPGLPRLGARRCSPWAIRPSTTRGAAGGADSSESRRLWWKTALCQVLPFGSIFAGDIFYWRSDHGDSVEGLDRF